MIKRTQTKILLLLFQYLLCPQDDEIFLCSTFQVCLIIVAVTALLTYRKSRIVQHFDHLHLPASKWCQNVPFRDMWSSCEIYVVKVWLTAWRMAWVFGLINSKRYWTTHLAEDDQCAKAAFRHSAVDGEGNMARGNNDHFLMHYKILYFLSFFLSLRW